MASEMTFTFAFGGDPQDVTIALSGRADAAGLRRLNAELIDDSRFRAGVAILVDLSELEAADFTPETLQDATESILERDWRAEPLAVAIVAPAPETFEMAGLFRAHLGGSRSKRGVFTNHAEAVAWLRDQRADAR